MSQLEWTIWAFGCLILLLGLTLIGSGKVMGRAALFFCLCTAAALAFTFFVLSPTHLLWMIPVAAVLGFLLALWLGAKMVRSGIKTAITDPRLRETLRKAQGKQSDASDSAD